MNNTFTINGKNHNSRLGGGVVEGFTASKFDYACGFSGPAITDGKHYRNLVLVHGSGEANSYFVVFDEMEAAVGNTVINYLHPANQSSVTETKPREAYEAEIDHYPSVNGVKLAFLYATPPVEVNIAKVQSAVPDRYPGYPEHSRLESVYHINSMGKKNAVTVLYPYSNNVPKASLERLTGEGFTGGSIRHSEMVCDYVLESAGETIIISNGVSLKAKAAVWRANNDLNDFYFVRMGTRFIMEGTGFESDLPVSLYIKGDLGVIISSGTKIRLQGPAINSIRFDQVVDIVSSGKDFVEFQMAAGTVYFSK